MQQPANASVIALVLAAGSSIRFGSDKRVALLPNGRRMLEATLQNTQSAFHRVCVVLRTRDDPSKLAIPDTVESIFCTDADAGMAHSLAAGIRYLQDQPGTAVALLLGDMPWIKSDTLHLLCAQATTKNIVYPEHQNKRGHPVLFGRDFWPSLMQLEGDAGARVLIEKNPLACLPVSVDDPGILYDVDHPKALQECPFTAMP